jgi:hypothetical protein
LFRAEAISAFDRGLRDFVADPFLPARGVGASVFFVALAMLRPYAKIGRHWVAPIWRMQRILERSPFSLPELIHAARCGGACFSADLGPR